MNYLAFTAAGAGGIIIKPLNSRQDRVAKTRIQSLLPLADALVRRNTRRLQINHNNKKMGTKLLL